MSSAKAFLAFEVLAAVFCECTWEMQGGTPEDFFYVQYRVQNERKMVKYYVPVFQQFYLNRWDRLSLKHRSRKMIFWINLSVSWGKHRLILMYYCRNSCKETHDKIGAEARKLNQKIFLFVFFFFVRKVNTLLYASVLKPKFTLVRECASFSALPCVVGLDFIMWAHMRK